MERELMTREELIKRINNLEEANLELQKKNKGLVDTLDLYRDDAHRLFERRLYAEDVARRAILVYKKEHGFNDYRAAQAEIMQKYDAFMNDCKLYGKAVKGVSND